MYRKITTYLLFLIVLNAASYAQAKVYDCFMFFNEIELLKMRLEELDEVVDYFVLVESIETQRGTAKPLYFSENKHFFEKYLHKVIPVIVDETHPEFDMWERENFQRNCILRGLQECDSSDLILISDLDEIPRPTLVHELVASMPKRNARLLQRGQDKKFKKHNDEKLGLSKSEKMFYLNGARAFVQPIYFFQLNRQSPHGQAWGGGPWIGTVVTTYQLVSKFGVQHFREYRWKFPRVHNGGWHFTWMGGKDQIRKKFCSVVEGRSDGDSLSDEELDQWINHHPVVPIDESFPNYVQNNFDYLKSLGFIADY